MLFKQTQSSKKLSVSSDKMRSFTIQSADVDLPPGYKGRFEISDTDTPSSAARKAAHSLFDISGASAGRPIEFVLRETTRSSAKQQFPYIGYKELRPVPKVTRLANGEQFVSKYEYRAQSSK